MRVFVAGGSGVLGRRLVPQLVARGHHVTATTRTVEKLRLLEQLGAAPILMNGLDAAQVGEAVAGAEPEVIVHHMTSLSAARADTAWSRVQTGRLRSEGTDHLLAAAEGADVSHVVAQSHAGDIPPGGWTGREQVPRESPEWSQVIKQLDDAVTKAGGAVLRYGRLYGPGANTAHLAMIQERMSRPGVSGNTPFSWVHVDDAAAATVLAVERKAEGIFNIVDDEPAPIREWLPLLAESAGVMAPGRMSAWLEDVLADESATGLETDRPGLSNTKAKEQLGWVLRYPSWRQGFQAELEGKGS